MADLVRPEIAGHIIHALAQPGRLQQLQRLRLRAGVPPRLASREPAAGQGFEPFDERGIAKLTAHRIQPSMSRIGCP